MTQLFLNTLALNTGTNLDLIKSWFDKGLFKDEKTGEEYISSKPKVIPFLKWAGGKRQILEELEKYLPNTFNDYYEPFLGGGSFYFHLKNKNLIKKESYLSDYNSELINTYNEIKTRPSLLMKKLELYKKLNSKEFFYEIRSWDREKNFLNKSKSKRAARFIYLNKTCFNGIWRVNSKGQNNVPYGNHKNASIYNENNIYSINTLLNDRTYLSSGDFKKILETAKKGDFIFLDPPYDPISKTSNFTSYNGFTFCENMQREVFYTFTELDKRGCKVMMTNNATEFIEALYSEYIEKFNRNIIPVRRYINCKGQHRDKVDEIIIKNY